MSGVVEITHEQLRSMDDPPERGCCVMAAYRPVNEFHELDYRNGLWFHTYGELDELDLGDYLGWCKPRWTSSAGSSVPE